MTRCFPPRGVEIVVNSWFAIFVSLTVKISRYVLYEIIQSCKNIFASFLFVMLAIEVDFVSFVYVLVISITYWF